MLSDPETAWTPELHHLLEKVPVGTLLLDRRYRKILLINQTAREIFASFLIEPTFNAVEELLLLPIAEELFVNRSDFKNEICIEHGVIGYSAYLIGNSHICLYIRDITELRHLQTISQSMFIMQNINIIFSSIRHELGNPLSILKTSLAMLTETSPDASAPLPQVHVQRCIRACHSMEEFLASLRSYHFFENLTGEKVDLLPLLKNTLEQFASMLPQPARQLRLETPLSVCWVWGNKRGFYQVFMNLLKNAVESAVPERQLEIVVRVREGRKNVRVEIQDNGGGIDPNHLPRVYMPLFSTKKRGSGLGLAIAKKILLQFSAAIDIASELGRGTTATVILGNLEHLSQKADGFTAPGTARE